MTDVGRLIAKAEAWFDRHDRGLWPIGLESLLRELVTELTAAAHARTTLQTENARLHQELSFADVRADGGLPEARYAKTEGDRLTLRHALQQLHDATVRHNSRQADYEEGWAESVQALLAALETAKDTLARNAETS